MIKLTTVAGKDIWINPSMIVALALAKVKSGAEEVEVTQIRTTQGTWTVTDRPSKILEAM